MTIDIQPETIPSDGGHVEDAPLEVIVPGGGYSIRWIEHGYPCDLTKWHHHPEIEFHLIEKTEGQMMIGDAMIPFSPGQVSLIGSNVPHNWISMLDDDVPYVDDREIACQIRPELVRRMTALFPEVSRFDDLLRRSAYGLVFSGGTARRLGDLLSAMRDHSPTQRCADFIQMLVLASEAPPDEYRCVLNHAYVPSPAAYAYDRLNRVFELVRHNLGHDLGLENVADAVGLSPESFSRFFHKNTGMTYSAFVTKMRLSKACTLLVSSRRPIAAIRRQCGFSNSSNFNRLFLREVGMTPTEFRQSQTRVDPISLEWFGGAGR